MLTTILIIDKRKELSVKYRKSLEDADTNAVIAGTLQGGLKNIQELEPDMIIISDSIEEKLSEFCRKIRALTYNTRPIIVALSKSAEVNDRIEVLEGGADDFISEPVVIEEFKSRIKAHLRRDIESNLDNKTLLPNRKIVYKALKRAIANNNSAVLLCGIENLEEYKTIYTELASDKIVQTFVAIIKSALDEADFVGQLDEAEFVIITNKYSAEKLAAFLTFAFDTVAPKFYSNADAKRGYMLMKGERYAGMRANFVSVLIGGMLDGFNTLSGADSLLSRLIEVKKLAKVPSGSNYVIDRAKITAADSVVEEAFARNIYIREADESLRYLIRTALELQGYDVQEELDVEDSNQPAIIIMDSGQDLAELEFLKGLKEKQSFANTKFIVTTTVHDKSAILNSGADLYLPKPYEVSDLIRWVEYFIKNRV